MNLDTSKSPASNPTPAPHSVVIVDAARTPIGGLQGDLASLSAPQLGAHAIRAAVARAGVDPTAVDAVLMGCVLPAGLGQAPARQAAINAGLPQATGCTTLNKMCGSGMAAVMLGHDLICAGSAHRVLAGGMESMSNAPYLLPRARQGLRMGHGEVKDHMFLDGLEDAYEPGRLMGSFAEQTATHFGFTRAAQDAYAIESLQRARHAIETGVFAAEIEPVTITERRGKRVISDDEQPPRADLQRIPELRPAFAKGGTVTAANSSSISDGAAALVLMSEAQAEQQGLKPRARILGHVTFAQEPAWFTTAPVHAIRQLLRQIDRHGDEIDLYEINEAFAVVAMAALHELALPHDKVNVHGGACALGHPIGASGARILVSLLNALEQRHAGLGVAAICIGGGEATAVALERIT